MTNDAIVSVWDIITANTVCGQYPSEKRFILITYKERKKISSLPLIHYHNQRECHIYLCELLFLSIYLLPHVFRIDPRALKCFKLSADISFLN